MRKLIEVNIEDLNSENAVKVQHHILFCILQFKENPNQILTSQIWYRWNIETWKPKCSIVSITTPRESIRGDSLDNQIHAMPWTKKTLTIHRWYRKTAREAPKFALHNICHLSPIFMCNYAEIAPCILIYRQFLIAHENDFSLKAAKSLIQASIQRALQKGQPASQWVSKKPPIIAKIGLTSKFGFCCICCWWYDIGINNSSAFIIYNIIICVG